jgi:hypothetical protein
MSVFSNEIDLNVFQQLVEAHAETFLGILAAIYVSRPAKPRHHA